MKTKNDKYLDVDKNKEYYSHSDGNFMPIEHCTMAHRVLDRVDWARKWVHELSAQTIVDIGCKDGYLDLTLASEGIECVGVDPSKDAIDEAQTRAMELNVDNVTFICGFAEQVPDTIHADVVTSLEVIEHVVDVDVFLKKLSTIGTYVMISTPDAHGRHGLKDSERNEEHVRLFTKKELEKAVSKYGHIVESIDRDDQLLIIFKSYRK